MKTVDLQLREQVSKQRCGPEPTTLIQVRNGLGQLVIATFPQFQLALRLKRVSSPKTIQIRLILPDPTAIGVGLKHASRTTSSHDEVVAYGSVTRG